MHRSSNVIVSNGRHRRKHLFRSSTCYLSYSRRFHQSRKWPISSKKDEHSKEDSVGIKDGLITPPSSIRLTSSTPSTGSGWPSIGSPSPSSCSDRRPSRIISSPNKSIVAARLPSSNASSPLDGPFSNDPSSSAHSSDALCSDRTKAKTNRNTSSRKSGRNKNNNEATPGSDDILGPFAHGLQHSTRETLLRGANALRDQFGNVCALQLAQLFWANSTLGAPHWPKLDQGERSIKKLGKNNSDLKHTKKRRELDDADKRRNETGGLATKATYRLIKKRKKVENDLNQDRRRKRQLCSTDGSLQ